MMKGRIPQVVLAAVVSSGTLALMSILIPSYWIINAQAQSTDYVVVDTGQTSFYDNLRKISIPQPGEPFYGQDAQYTGNAPSYALSGDGLTVYDNNTDLTWQRSPDTDGDGSITISDKLTWTQAQARPATLNAANYGGYSDWRLPTIKELYSLINFNGTDPDPMSTDTSGLTPFIDTDYFGFSYGFTSAGERIIDSQWVSSTLYVANTNQMFGVNFADGRIKGYPTSDFIGKKYFVICVRGNTDYGVNSFIDNDDGTITDSATGLIWTKSDSGTGMNWQEALAWVQTKNAADYLGHSDWRLPNAKELQSIVDYTRSPNTTGSAAIDPVFTCTSITNEAGQADFPSYWTGTTHARPNDSGDAGVYVAFGRAMGYMPPAGGWIDVHGAGAQRSDPKAGNPADYPFGRGPQGDAVRIYNYVRAVRGGVAEPVGPPNNPPTMTITSPSGGEVWTQGISQTITWTASDNEDASTALVVWINYTSSAGSGSVCGPVTGSAGSCLWTPPAITATDIVVNGTVMDSGGLKGYDESGQFTIQAPPPVNTPPTVNITSPVGGEEFLKDASHTITWTMDDDQDINANLTIYINYTTGGTTSQIVAALKGEVSFAWTLPSIEANDVVVNITVIDTGGLKGWSQSGPFTIKAPPPLPPPPDLLVQYWWLIVVIVVAAVVALLLLAWMKRRKPEAEEVTPPEPQNPPPSEKR